MDLHVVLLAAGKGTRMKTSRAKVLHTLCGSTMIRLVVERALSLKPKSVVVVVGTDADEVRKELSGYSVRFALQRQQLGTGHAAKRGMTQIREPAGDVLFLCGDTPMLRTETLRGLVNTHRRKRADLSVVTAQLNPAGQYGRIVRDAQGHVIRIVEARDATPSQLEITEFNTGIYCVKKDVLTKFLPRLRRQNDQREYLLTDVLGLVSRNSGRIADIGVQDVREVLGINTLEELADSARELRRVKMRQLMDGGVTVIDPQSTYVDWQCRVGGDSILHPQVILEGETTLGQGCRIRSFSRITNCRLDDGVTVLESCVLTESIVRSHTTIGPGAHIRAGSDIGESVRIGNYVEVKKSRIGKGTKAAHLSYIGDSEVGDRVNIGAGTITCNYDGTHKNKTVIEDEVFIGSDTQLIAPVRVGRGAYVAAGSTITEDVPAQALAIARGRQTNKPGWALGRRKRSP